MALAIAQLAQRIDALAADLPFALHWQLRDLTTSDVIGREAHRVVGSFSTRKVSVLMSCLALVKAERLNLDQPLTITEELKAGVQAGIMRNVAPGLQLSLRDHLAQMMVTSDNICTQLVFQAIETATGDALQWVNDYCAIVGMHDTVHREIFPRSADLAWSHAIDQMTVTSAHDQALVLARLARGSTDAQAAGELGLTQKLCHLATELMGHLYTPLFGQRLTPGTFAEKNGRGIRGLSQVGLYFDQQRQPRAALAVFAEHIPVTLLDGTPGRLRALDTFPTIGQLVDDHYAGSTTTSVPDGSRTEKRDTGELIYAIDGGPSAGTDTAFAFAGIGKLFFAQTIHQLSQQDPALLEQRVTITQAHRNLAATGTLKRLTGTLTVRVADAVQLMLGSNEGAAAHAVLDHLRAAGIDVVDHSRAYFADLPDTTITGLETASTGDGLTGTTTTADVLRLLSTISHEAGPVLGWMSKVFEPSGLASALPGYGPHTLEHWTVSGWERLGDHRPADGYTSVMLLPAAHGRIGIVAHAPAGTANIAGKFGALGRSATGT